MLNGSVNSGTNEKSEVTIEKVLNSASNLSDALLTIDDVQKTLNRSRASVYRYTNTDTRNLNPPFNPRKLNTEFRSDQKDQLLFHPNEVARFAKDILRIKEVTVEILNSPSSETQNILTAILEELRIIRNKLDGKSDSNQNSISNHLQDTDRKAA
ncbi:resolvase [Prochlorococcus marinus]|uniref:resolvase n=1 Tax=Prochlorococcus marinus TaxID=1219 RepID=UPI0022B3A538|nr:resolvase [Prochlorococcus marinus]